MASATSPPTGLLRVVAEGGALGSWSDADLLARFAASRRAPDEPGALAFEVLVRRHGAMVRGVCRRILLDPGDADDAFQATFLVLVRRAGAVRVGDSLGPWLFGVARRVARRARLDRDRQRRREGTGADAALERAAPEPTDPRLAEVLAVLDAEVARLPEPFRSALVLCDLGGRTIEEAGREFGCPPGTIKSRLHRARDRLKGRLARRGFGGPDVQPALLGALAPPPESLVASAVARCTASAPSGLKPSPISWPFLARGASRMIALNPIRWFAVATLSGTLGALGTTYLSQAPAAKPTQDTAEPAKPPLDRIQTARTTGPDGLPREFHKVTLPDYVVEPPDILLIQAVEALPGRPINGEYLIRPDGRISLGFYGEPYVAGLTIAETKAKVVEHLKTFLTEEALGLKSIGKDGHVTIVKHADSDRVAVDVAIYNSKVYYVEGDVATPGRLPVTGSETVLDALHYAGGLVARATGKFEITLIRPSVAKDEPQRLSIDLRAIEQGDSRTNYQMMPADRLVVRREMPVSEELLSNAHLAHEVRSQDYRLKAVERKLDLLLEKIDRLADKADAEEPPANRPK